MRSRFLQITMASIVTVAILARLLPRPGAAPVRTGGEAISYHQLRHLLMVTVFLVLGLWLAFWFIAQTREVLTLLAISSILAVALRPTVDRMSAAMIPMIHGRMRRALAIFILYLLLLSIATGIGVLVVPQLLSETQKLAAAVPGYVAALDSALRNLQGYPYLPDLAALQGELISQLLGSVSQAINVLLFAVNLVGGFLSVGLVLVLTFFLILDADAIYEHFTSLLPPSHQDRARALTAEMGRKIEGWLKGTLMLSTFIGTSTALAMWLLDMPYPLLLGLAAGLFEVLPIVGAYLGAAPAVILALFQPVWKLAAVVVFFFIVQQVENNVLAPTVMGREVRMPPLLVILALFFGASLMGILGALLAVPVVAVLQVLWTDLVVPEMRQRQGE